MQLIQVLNLGRMDYGTALQLQETLVELRKQGRIADTMLLVEHDPVITLGRNAKSANIVASEAFLRERGMERFEINRGGDVTFHGPGQLVGYPICDLRQMRVPGGAMADKRSSASDAVSEDAPEQPKPAHVGAVEFVRRLEETLIRTCAEWAIDTQRIAGLTGVWTRAGAGVEKAGNPRASGPEKKIAAIGVHISRGVTSHGFALNVTTDLDYFKLIVPCGITDKPVTSMEQEVGDDSPKPLTMDAVQQVLTRQFGNVFGVQILWLESLDSLLSSASPANEDQPVREPEDLKKLREELHINSGDTHLA